jgi:hypothetical protein
VGVPFSLYLQWSTNADPSGAHILHDGPPGTAISAWSVPSPGFSFGCTYGQSIDRDIVENTPEVHRKVLNNSPKFPDEIVMDTWDLITRLSSRDPEMKHPSSKGSTSAYFSVRFGPTVSLFIPQLTGRSFSRNRSGHRYLTRIVTDVVIQTPEKEAAGYCGSSID